MTSRGGLLGGVRVLDLCHFLAGPYGSAMLASLGADVIKLEDPDHPDEARTIGPDFIGDQSIYFLSLNSGKRSLALRLRQGHDVVLDLVRHVDVVVDNYKPSVMAGLGLDHKSLSEVNPGIITCSLSGYGATGPLANQPGYDYTIQAMAGVMDLTGEPDGPPGKAGISYVDHAGGLASALAICAALFDRQRSGTGTHIDMSLYDVQMSMLSYLAAWRLNGSFTPGRTASGAHPYIVPAQNFATRDGYLTLFVGNEPMWMRLVNALGDSRLTDSCYATMADRQENKESLLAVLREILLSRSTREWVTLLEAHSIPCAPVNSIAEALKERQTLARNLIATATHPAYGAYRYVPGPFGSLSEPSTAGAPPLGEDTTEILSEIGYAPDRIADLLESGVIFQAARPDPSSG